MFYSSRCGEMKAREGFDVTMYLFILCPPLKFWEGGRGFALQTAPSGGKSDFTAKIRRPVYQTGNRSFLFDTAA